MVTSAYQPFAKTRLLSGGGTPSRFLSTGFVKFWKWLNWKLLVWLESTWNFYLLGEVGGPVNPISPSHLYEIAKVCLEFSVRKLEKIDPKSYPTLTNQNKPLACDYEVFRIMRDTFDHSMANRFKMLSLYINLWFEQTEMLIRYAGKKARHACVFVS